MHPKGRCQNRLGTHTIAASQQYCEHQQTQCAGYRYGHLDTKDNLNKPHGKTRKVRPCAIRPSVGRLRRGSLIVELAMAMALLTAIGLVVFKGSLDLMAPRQWTIYQNVSDAYITYEEAYAERISFDELTDTDSPWPIYPLSTTSEVEIGKFPGGNPIMAKVIRTRIADPNNLPTAGGSGSITTNPSEMETWQVQCHLTYTIGDNEYVKSRTVIRSQ